MYGRYGYNTHILEGGRIQKKTTRKPMAEWAVLIHDHHPGYISWEQYLRNQEILAANRTNGEENLLSGPAREGLALLHGLLLCAKCGRRITVRYKGNGGIHPAYECNWQRKDGYSVPGKYAGRKLLLKLYPERLCLYDGQALVAERKLSWRTHLRKIMALAEVSGADKVARALDDALEYQAFSSEYIANILEQRERRLPEPGPLNLIRKQDQLEIDRPAPARPEWKPHNPTSSLSPA